MCQERMVPFFNQISPILSNSTNLRLLLPMHLLLCAATEFEIEPTIQLLNTHPFGSEHQIDILITGVGLLPAAFHITQQILQQRPQYIIQAGVAGSIDKSLLLGETVLVQREQIGDSGVLENGNFTTIFDMALAEKNQYP